MIVLNRDNRNGKERLQDTQNMGKGLQKVFKTVVKVISQYLPPFG